MVAIILEYEVMDTFKAENEDEIELYPGDKVVILSKSMDGWWKIKYVFHAVQLHLAIIIITHSVTCTFQEC